MKYNGFRYAIKLLSPSTPRAPYRHASYTVLVALLLLLVSGAARAQGEAGPQRATREELSQRIAAAENLLADGSLKGKKRTQVQNEVAATKARLEQGDFQVGDRFVVTLNHDAAVRADTASVREGLLVTLFDLPAPLSVGGVLRSELDARLASHVARYLKDATIRANVLTRVGIFGAVRSPGYYLASPDRPVTELVMLAGGPTPDANIDQLEIKRSNRTILNAKASRAALKEGRTLEQLDVQSGDDVRIATKRKINWGQIIQLFFVVSSLFFAFIQFLQWYYRRDE